MNDVSKVWPVEIVPIDSVSLHPDNFREHDVGALVVSIEVFDLYTPLVVQRSTGHIVVGNGRWEALKARGETEVPVHFVDVDDRKAKAMLLADNWQHGRGRNMPTELLVLMQELQADEILFRAAGLEDDDVTDLEREVMELDKPLKLDSRKLVKPRKLQKVTCPECGHKFEIGGKAQ